MLWWVPNKNTGQLLEAVARQASNNARPHRRHLSLCDGLYMLAQGVALLRSVTLVEQACHCGRGL